MPSFFSTSMTFSLELFIGEKFLDKSMYRFKSLGIVGHLPPPTSHPSCAQRLWQIYRFSPQYMGSLFIHIFAHTGYSYYCRLLIFHFGWWKCHVIISTALFWLLKKLALFSWSWVIIALWLSVFGSVLTLSMIWFLSTSLGLLQTF